MRSLFFMIAILKMICFFKRSKLTSSSVHTLYCSDPPPALPQKTHSLEISSLLNSHSKIFKVSNKENKSAAIQWIQLIATMKLKYVSKNSLHTLINMVKEQFVLCRIKSIIFYLLKNPYNYTIYHICVHVHARHQGCLRPSFHQARRSGYLCWFVQNAGQW